ncbi:MAG: peptidylprolyl isomerase [Bacteroidota bacterium]
MRFSYQILLASSLLFFVAACGPRSEKVQKTESLPAIPLNKDTAIAVDNAKTTIPEEAEKPPFKLTEDTAIDFFFGYAKENPKNQVRLTTNMGSFTVQLYDNVPYHRANFVFLAEQGYFNQTQFHRVVPDFIIQGGNSDDKQTSQKRKAIGRYLLPPDTKKGHRHHRGTLSMPSSERDNPHKLASPYEFFIVVTQPGSYHLDGSYTPFGKVIEGMDVVDKINQVPTDKGEWPMRNVYIEKAEVL